MIPARSGTRRAALASAVLVTLMTTGPARAGGSSMPWEAPLQSVLESIEGPVAKIVAVIIINGTLAGALGLGLRLWIIGLAVWTIGHALSVWAARRDPHFVEVARRHLKYPVWMRP